MTRHVYIVRVKVRIRIRIRVRHKVRVGLGLGLRLGLGRHVGCCGLIGMIAASCNQLLVPVTVTVIVAASSSIKHTYIY